MKDFSVRYSDDGSPNVDLELEGHPYHKWLGWPSQAPRLGPETTKDVYRVKGIKPGVRVRIDFTHCGLGVEGVHWLTLLRKATLLERMKVHFFGKL